MSTEQNIPYGASTASSHLLGVSPGLLCFSQNYPHRSSSSIPEQSSLPIPPPPRPPTNPLLCLDSLRSLEKNLTQPTLCDEPHQQNSDWSTGISRFISDNCLTQCSGQQKQWRSSNAAPVCALCVLLSKVMKIYFNTGKEFTLAVPFPIQKAWPIERGVMMMKKPTSVCPRPFIWTSQVLPVLSNQLKLKNLSRRSILGDSQWPSSAQAGSTSEPLGFNSMMTENEAHPWSSVTGFNLDNHQVLDHGQLEVGDEAIYQLN
ncbi:hypothetical protein PCANC_16023 [Puccinia coronata f. sp. avenae]|uniref:Anaphase-promoting complex subunit 1 N-terminal domain-containing protein n=1 Tax=Puccinia coronata f. sp. avenae TaxID=200324 RepID=A0A2N5ULP8_9BASI|nr:hypothetical protein PCANC_16023 [Puccinia coronata f. sp. avenae]